MLSFVFLVVGVVVGWAARGKWGKKAVKNVRDLASAATLANTERTLMLLHDGTNWRLGAAELVARGDKPAVEVSGLGHTLPLGACNELLFAGITLYVFTLARVQLIEQDALQAARETVDMSAMFTGGGEGKQMLPVVSSVICIVAVVLIWFQVSGVGTATAKTAESVGAIKAAVVDKPIACRVLP